MLEFGTNVNTGSNGGMPTMGQFAGANGGYAGANMTPPPATGVNMGQRPASAGTGASTISLKKGQKISLTKAAPSMKHVLVGLGWSTQRYTGAADFDLDASAFLVDNNGRTAPDGFVFYGAACSTADGRKCDGSESVIHSGDNKVGGDGVNDDEQMTIDLSKIPANIQKVAISCTIYDSERRRQNFGMVSNAYIRIVDNDTGAEVARYDLGEDFSTETAVVIGEIYRHNGEWRFNAVGSGYSGGLAMICRQYGLDVEGE